MVSLKPSKSTSPTCLCRGLRWGRGLRRETGVDADSKGIKRRPTRSGELCLGMGEPEGAAGRGTGGAAGTDGEKEKEVVLEHSERRPAQRVGESLRRLAWTRVRRWEKRLSEAPITGALARWICLWQHGQYNSYRSLVRLRGLATCKTIFHSTGQSSFSVSGTCGEEPRAAVILTPPIWRRSSNDRRK